ncbi:helix-turn-helix domain-containing protein [Gottfriedia sp. NPDC056225]|uniref:helix-turn-helix domain-containing protein n=1 Tax=Gottfriedia sp. NPDC056225 TaxID=3345751 RepID=UPI0035D8AC92
MKQGIQIIASEDTYFNLRTFKEVNELNEAVRAYKVQFKCDLSKSAKKVLELLQRYSTKYLGVSFLSKNTIADKLEISRRTVIRVCHQLEKLGIIKQYEMKRNKDMMQTSNAIVIQALNSDDVTQEVVEMSHQENNTYLKQNNNNNHLNVKRIPYIKFVPRNLQHFQAFLGSVVKDLYGRVWLAAKKLNVIVGQETMQKVGFITVSQIKHYIKSGKQLTNEQQLKLAYKIAYNQLQQLECDKPLAPVDYSYILTIASKKNLSSIGYKKEDLNELGIY